MGQDDIRIIDVLGMLERKDCLFVDLRDEEDYHKRHLKGAVNIPYESLQEKKEMLSGWRRIYLYCDRGNASLLASRDLRREGYPVVNLWGGVHGFEKELRRTGKNNIDYIWEKN